jgi:uncharacterized protein YigA (DUF484 family)
MADVKAAAAKTAELALDPPQFNEDEVAVFLKNHPDFLTRYPQLLEIMELRHAAGTAVSLIERQVEVLRGRCQRLEDRLAQLSETAKENELRASSVQRLARTLLGASTLGQVLAGLTKCMRDDFDIDGVYVGVHPKVTRRNDIEGLHRLDTHNPVVKVYDDFFRTRLIECGPIDAERSALFFPNAKAPMQSAAIVPLEKESGLGMLVLASAEPERFQPRQGKLFLEMTAELVSAAIRARLA